MRMQSGRCIVRCFILNDYRADACQPLSDDALIGRFRSGDEDAFEAIVSRYVGLISSAAARYSGVAGDLDAGDLVQEGLVVLLFACRDYDASRGSSFKNYLMRCVRHRYVSILRHVNRESAVPVQNIVSIEDEDDSVPDVTSSSPCELVETKEHIARLYQNLRDRLSDFEYRVALLHLSGYSYKEIAERLDVPLKTVDNAQTRIRQKLSR